MLRSVNLEDYMVDKPITVAPETPLIEAVDLITKNRVSGLCVVNETGQLLGILSELDCLRGILGASYDQGSIGLVQDYMVSANITSAKPGDHIIDIATDMLSKGQRRRPVVNDSGQLVGQITCRQILAAVRQLSAGN